jgi:hypothetical protein
MIKNIDLTHLDDKWLTSIQNAAVVALERINEDAQKTQVTPEQAALATMAGGFLYLYHLAQVNDLIESDNTPTSFH